MIRSPGFGSIRSDFKSPYSDSLSLRLRILLLNQATSYKSPAHSSTGTRSGSSPSHCLSAYGFMFYFTPQRGFFSPFPRGTISLSVTQEYLALRGGPRWFTRDSTCPMLLGIWHFHRVYNYWTFTIYGAGFSCFVFFYFFDLSKERFVFPLHLFTGLGCSRFARRYYGNRVCFLFLQLLRCFNSLGFLFPTYEFCRKF